MDLPNQLESKRLLLRLFRQDDLKDISNFIDDEFSNNLKYILNLRSETNKTSFFKSILNSYNSKNPIIALVILSKHEEKIIGLCGLIPLEDGNTAETLYTVFPKYRGNGYAIEAMKKLIEFAFKGLTLSKIIIFINPRNTKAWKVAERIGMKYLGHKQLNANSINAMFFSIEKVEFEAQLDY